MTKTKKLLLLVCAFAVLLGAYLAITALRGDTSPEIPDGKNEETPKYDIFSLNANALTAFSYTLDGVEYAYTLADDAASWTWDGDHTLPISNGQITMMMQTLLSVSSQYRLENIAQNTLADFGLDDSAMRLKLTYQDGKSDTLLFGSTNAYNSMVYFCLDSDMTTVYMVEASLPGTFAVLPSDIVENDSLPTYKKTQFSGFMLEINGANYTAKYAYENDEPAADEEKQLTLYINSGEGTVTDAEVRDALITEFLGWKLKDAATFDPQNYAQYGVADDTANTLSVYYTYTMEYKDETTGTTNSTEVQGVFKLLLGNAAEDGKTYVRLSDGKGVYALDMTTLMSLHAE